MEITGPKGMASVGYDDKKKKKLPKKRSKQPIKAMDEVEKKMKKSVGQKSRLDHFTSYRAQAPIENAVSNGRQAARDMGAQLDDNPLDLRK